MAKRGEVLDGLYNNSGSSSKRGCLLYGGGGGSGGSGGGGMGHCESLVVVLLVVMLLWCVGDLCVATLAHELTRIKREPTTRTHDAN